MTQFGSGGTVNLGVIDTNGVTSSLTVKGSSAVAATPAIIFQIERQAAR